MLPLRSYRPLSETAVDGIPQASITTTERNYTPDTSRRDVFLSTRQASRTVSDGNWMTALSAIG
jgi:hypothetical protein